MNQELTTGYWISEAKHVDCGSVTAVHAVCKKVQARSQGDPRFRSSLSNLLLNLMRITKRLVYEI